MIFFASLLLLRLLSCELPSGSDNRSAALPPYVTVTVLP
jgi:hypothetical protein